VIVFKTLKIVTVYENAKKCVVTGTAKNRLTVFQHFSLLGKKSPNTTWVFYFSICHPLLGLDHRTVTECHQSGECHHIS
jgi:hypothetical protein